MTLTSPVLSNWAGEDTLRRGRGLFLGAGGRGLEGGFISKLEDIGITGALTLLRGSGDRSAPGLGEGATLNGDEGRGEGGGRRGLLGRSGRPGSGFFGGSIGLETFFNERRVSFFCKSVNRACLPDA